MILPCSFQGPKLPSTGFETPLGSFKATNKREASNDEELQQRRGMKVKRRLAFDTKISMGSEKITKNVRTGLTTLRSKMEVR